MVRRMLSHSISISAVLHVMPAKQHLPGRTTRKEQQRWIPLAPVHVRRQEQLTMNLQPIGTIKNYLLWFDECCVRRLCGNAVGSKILRIAGTDYDRGTARPMPV